MKKILVWSMQHTGTYFCVHAISSGTEEDRKVTGFGSIWCRHETVGTEPVIKDEVKDFSDYYPLWDSPVTEHWYDCNIFDLAVYHPGLLLPEGDAVGETDWNKIDLFVAHEHYHRRHNSLWQSLMQYKPICPVVIPMRDPFLSLHSKNWREIEKHKSSEGANKEARLWRANAWTERYLDLLSIPKEHAFIMPIDTPAMLIPEKRVEVYERLYEHCGLPFNEKAREHALQWAVQNSTAQLLETEVRKSTANRWTGLKDNYRLGKRESVEKLMRLELKYLRKQSGLIAKLRAIGYENLMWWRD